MVDGVIDRFHFAMAIGFAVPFWFATLAFGHGIARSCIAAGVAFFVRLMVDVVRLGIGERMANSRACKGEIKRGSLTYE